MLDFYLKRIKNNLMILEEVPPLWRALVKVELEKLNKINNEIEVNQF